MFTMTDELVSLIVSLCGLCLNHRRPDLRVACLHICATVQKGKNTSPNHSFELFIVLLYYKFSFSFSINNNIFFEVLHNYLTFCIKKKTQSLLVRNLHSK